ncbi:unnamed protein product [Ilex paraguariensis]|uniref:Cyclin-like domain-containing protein n=1 Tax=Ilex paraguariensis TaxID=185542 RepID=A0ABC8QYV9_9AQUA
MKKMVISAVREPTARITRARAACLQQSGGKPSSEVPKQQDQKRVLRTNSKRAALDERNTSVPVAACVQQKRRAVLRDVTNVCCDNSYKKCLNATKISKKNSKQANKSSVHASKAVSVAVKIQQVPAELTSIGQEIGKAESLSAGACSMILEENIPLQLNTETIAKEYSLHNPQLGKQPPGNPSPLQKFSTKEKFGLYEKQMVSSNPDFTDIDSDHKDPQLCSIYAPDIYSNLRVAELVRRPHSNFMETVQRDITQSMRGILVDWLVEVCEEYKLVPDTLYLTVCLIDWFLSQNYIERQRLQLLGITCMLIASKYEEICAPRVEELCFITDNTYTKGEDLKYIWLMIYPLKGLNGETGSVMIWSSKIPNDKIVEGYLCCSL